MDPDLGVSAAIGQRKYKLMEGAGAYGRAGDRSWPEKFRPVKSGRIKLGYETAINDQDLAGYVTRTFTTEENHCLRHI